MWPPQPAPAARVANTTLGRDDLHLDITLPFPEIRDDMGFFNHNLILVLLFRAKTMPQNCIQISIKLTLGR